MIKKEEIKLLKLMKAYYKKDILFDEEFVYKVVEIIEKSRKLDGFIDDVILLDKSKIGNNAIGSYSPNTKVVQISLPEEKEKNNQFLYNSKLLHLVLHELEHVCQHKLCSDNNTQSFNKDLLNACFSPNNYIEILSKKIKDGNFSIVEMQNIMYEISFYEKYAEIIHKCYGCLPSERQAEINSLSELCSLFKNIRIDNYQDNIIGLQKGYTIRKLMGYEFKDNELVYPTYEFYRDILELYDNLDIDKYFSKFDRLSENMSLDERLFYGFKISEDEYKGELLKLTK